VTASPSLPQTDTPGEKRFAGKLSDDYPLWRLARPFLGEVHGVVTREIGKFTAGRAGSLHALDIGMGDGSITKLLLADAKLDVVGVDNEPKMIAQARERLSGAVEAGRLSIVLDDAQHFLASLPAKGLDIVASGYVLHNLTVDDRQPLYGEIWRVLKPGGLLINADKYAQSGGAHRAALRWQLGLFFDVFSGHGRYDTLRDWVLHYVEDEMPDTLMPEADAIAQLTRIGFTGVKIVYRKHMDAVLIARKPG
jgi:tRNA (cmo5U34)-methyltransferase